MIKQIYQLPEAFFNGRAGDTDLYIYHTGTSSGHNQVNFSRHLLCFLLEGRKDISSGTEHISFDSSHIVLLKAGHTLMTERVSGNNCFRSLLLFFSNDFLLDLLRDDFLRTDRKDVSVPHLLGFRKDEYILNFERSLLLLGKSAVENQDLLRSKCGEILLYLFGEKKEEMIAFMQSALDDNRHISFRQVIEGQADLNLGVEELAFLCHMSVSAFKRKFTEIFHTSPRRYFVRQKMQKALLLLKQGKRPSEICYDLGYNSLSAFSSEFKKHFGVSPRSYTQNRLPETSI